MYNRTISPCTTFAPVVSATAIAIAIAVVLTPAVMTGTSTAVRRSLWATYPRRPLRPRLLRPRRRPSLRRDPRRQGRLAPHAGRAPDDPARPAWESQGCVVMKIAEYGWTATAFANYTRYVPAAGLPGAHGTGWWIGCALFTLHSARLFPPRESAVSGTTTISGHLDPQIHAQVLVAVDGAPQLVGAVLQSHGDLSAAARLHCR